MPREREFALCEGVTFEHQHAWRCTAGNLHKSVCFLSKVNRPMRSRARQRNADSHERRLRRVGKHTGLHCFINPESRLLWCKTGLSYYSAQYNCSYRTADAFLTTHSPSRLSGSNALSCFLQVFFLFLPQEQWIHLQPIRSVLLTECLRLMAFTCNSNSEGDLKKIKPWNILTAL